MFEVSSFAFNFCTLIQAYRILIGSRTTSVCISAIRLEQSKEWTSFGETCVWKVQFPSSRSAFSPHLDRCKMSLRPTVGALQRVARNLRNPRALHQTQRQLGAVALIPRGGTIQTPAEKSLPAAGKPLSAFGKPLRALTTAVTPETGFSYPGPRKLSEIVKIQLLNKHTSGKVKEIWDSYHRDHKTAIGHTLSAEEYSLLKGRSERCRHFVLPVPR